MLLKPFLEGRWISKFWYNIEFNYRNQFRIRINCVDQVCLVIFVVKICKCLEFCENSESSSSKGDYEVFLIIIIINNKFSVIFPHRVYRYPKT